MFDGYEEGVDHDYEDYMVYGRGYNAPRRRNQRNQEAWRLFDLRNAAIAAAKSFEADAADPHTKEPKRQRLLALAAQRRQEAAAITRTLRSYTPSARRQPTSTQTDDWAAIIFGALLGVFIAWLIF